MAQTSECPFIAESLEIAIKDMLALPGSLAHLFDLQLLLLDGVSLLRADGEQTRQRVSFDDRDANHLCVEDRNDQNNHRKEHLNDQQSDPFPPDCDKCLLGQCGPVDGRFTAPLCQTKLQLVTTVSTPREAASTYALVSPVAMLEDTL